REPCERLQAPGRRAGLPEEGGARDGLADVVGDRLQECQLVAVERARLPGDQRHDAPDPVVHSDRQRELGVIAAGGDPLSYRGREHARARQRSEEHTSELQSPDHLVCRLLLEKKKKKQKSQRNVSTEMVATS